MPKITENKLMIGIDIGGTKMRGILWDGKKVLKSKDLPTPNNLIGFKRNIEKVINYLGKVELIFVGSAGIVENNILIESPNIPYVKNFDFSIYGVKKLDNDTRCFARTQYKLGGAAKEKSVLFITIGTGIGRAFGKDGKILRIKKFERPELWEKEYQKIRDLKDDQKLADYLGEKINKMAQFYKPKLIVLGGGALDRKGLFEKIKKQLNATVRKSVFSKGGAAFGAILLSNEKA